MTAGRAAQQAVMQGGVAAALAVSRTESVEFLNEIMAGMQPYIRIAASQMILDIVGPIFKTLPGPLSSLHFTKVDIGSVPFKFSNVNVDQVKSKGGVDTLSFEMDVQWDGDLDIEMDADYIPGFGVQHVKFFGRLSVLLRPLISRLPLVSAMQIALINPPELEMDFTGAAQALDLSVIDDAIRNTIQGVIAGIMVLPNRMLIKVDPLNDLYVSYLDPVAVIRVKVESGSGFKGSTGFIKDVPDVYCILKMGGNEPWTTSTKDNDETPEWMEEHDYLLSDNDQILLLDVYDADIGRDQHLGDGRITVGQLMEAGGRVSIPLTPKMGNEPNPEIAINLSCTIFNLVQNTTSFESAAAGDGSKMCGLLTILVANAKGLVGEAESMSTQVVVKAAEKTFTTGSVAAAPGIDANNPFYDAAYRVELTAETAETPDVKFTLKNKGASIGEYTVALADVLSAPGLAVESEFPVASGGVLRAKMYVLGMEPHV
jgi:Synaptotagmin-like mitochondrial-lipid-binding domain/C2 domain